VDVIESLDKVKCLIFLYFASIFYFGCIFVRSSMVNKVKIF